MSASLDGERLTIDQVQEVAERGVSVSLAPVAIEKMQASREPVERLAEGDDPIYGVNTGVGLLADIRVPRQDLDLLQLNVVRSHAAGVGPPLPRAVARAMMLIRANVLAKGFSGIRPVVAERLCDLLNRRVTPIIPEQGSVGASGDLAPLAHMALVLIGEGEAEFQCAVLPGGEALARAGLAPLQFHPKEGLSLINGTQAMLAIGCLELAAARTLAASADVIAALTLDALRGTPVAFDERIHAARPHPGQVESAARLRRLLEGSEIRQSHLTCRRVQDAYSLRCVPQVHGAVRDALAEAGRVFSIELNSATDNPLVFQVGQAFRPANNIPYEILSGGNFHGEPLAFQLDFLAIALSALAAISERRIDRLVNPALNEDLPPFLAGHAGLESGLMMAQVTAAALLSECRILSHPASVDSVPTSANREDHVSMGMTAALKARSIAEHARTLLAIELLVACQALDFRLPLRPAAPITRVWARVRQEIPPLTEDRELHRDIRRVCELIDAGDILAASR